MNVQPDFDQHGSSQPLPSTIIDDIHVPSYANGPYANVDYLNTDETYNENCFQHTSNGTYYSANINTTTQASNLDPSQQSPALSTIIRSHPSQPLSMAGSSADGPHHCYPYSHIPEDLYTTSYPGTPGSIDSRSASDGQKFISKHDIG
jgi:hypothetical protein